MIKRVAAAILVLTLSIGSAMAWAEVCVSLPGLAVLVDDDGGNLIPAGICQDIFAVRDGALYAAGQEGDYRLFDASGQMICEERFAMIHDAGDCLIIRRGHRFGAMDSEGAVILEPVWTQLTGDGAGGFLALNGDPLDEQPDELVRIDADGEAHTTGVYVMGVLGDIVNDRLPFKGTDGRYGVVNALGEVAIEPVWRYIGSFDGGLAVAEGDRGRGMIDADGSAVIPAKYVWLDRSEAMIAGLKEDGTIDVYAPDGTLAFTLEGLQANLIGSHVAVYDDEGARLYDSEGRLIWQASAKAAFYPGLDGKVIVADGAWGEPCQRLIDADGKSATEGFQQLLPLAGERYAWLSMTGAVYYSADLGSIQNSWNYDSARWGLADGAGKRLTDAVYLEIRPLSEDRLLLVTADEAILSDMDGAPIRRWTLPSAAVSSSEAAS